MLVNSIYKIQNTPDVLKYKKVVVEGLYYEKFGAILQAKGQVPDDIEVGINRYT